MGIYWCVWVQILLKEYRFQGILGKSSLIQKNIGVRIHSARKKRQIINKDSHLAKSTSNCHIRDRFYSKYK